MSILDDAIREHLELKRAHGANEEELKKLEDEAFGSAERPDDLSSLGEAPTEFLDSPGTAEGPQGRRASSIADLQEAPPSPTEAEPPPTEEGQPPTQEAAAVEGAPLFFDGEAGDDAAGPPSGETSPSEESHPATEHEAIPGADAGDVAAETEDAPGTDAAPEPKADPAPEPDAPPPPEPDAPPPPPEPDAPPPPPEPDAPPPPPEASHDTEERRAIADQPTQFFDVEAEMAGEEGPGQADGPTFEAEDEDDFFSEQRLADELDQALDAPLSGEEPPTPRAERPVPPSPNTEEAEAHYAEREEGEDEEEDEDALVADYEPEDEEHEDVLEDTPDFLEDTEADDAWFEQRPPKDFDFDD